MEMNLAITMFDVENCNLQPADNGKPRYREKGGDAKLKDLFRTKQDGQDFAGLTGYTMRFFDRIYRIFQD